MNADTATMSDPRGNLASDVSDCDVMVSLEVMTLLELTSIAAPDDVVVDWRDVRVDTIPGALGAIATETEDVPEGDVDGVVGTSYARCADGNGTLTHLFFSDDEFDIARAKAICGKCGRAETCLAGALDRAETYGVWGGQLVIDGVVVAVKRGRGRPPKHPRPPLVVDEVPLPPHLVA